MSSDPPTKLYPVMVMEDRYQGVYSGGRLWAVACANDSFQGMMRIEWLMETGPGSDDVTCAVFWSRPPPWIAPGRTPDEAVAALVAKRDAATNDWEPSSWEDGPRVSGLLRERAK